MSADQPCVGDTITTAEQLDALPDGSVVRDIDAVLGSRTIGATKSGWMLAGFENVVSSEFVIEQAESPLTVLYRPDAPPPPPVDGDAVERAHRAWNEYPDYDADTDERDAWRHERDRMAAALAAAGAGEAESCRECSGSGVLDDPATDRITGPCPSCQRGGEAEPRATLLRLADEVQQAEWPGCGDEARVVAEAVADMLRDEAAQHGRETEHACADERLTDSGSICRQCGEAVDREALALARNIVNQVLEGAVDQGGYQLVDMKARQRFNDVADGFVADLLAARGDAAPSMSADDLTQRQSSQRLPFSDDAAADFFAARGAAASSEVEWGVFDYVDGLWYAVNPSTRENAIRERDLLRAPELGTGDPGHAADVTDRATGLSMQNAVNHARRVWMLAQRRAAALSVTTEHDAEVAEAARQRLLRELRIEVGHSYHRSGESAPKSCACHALRRAEKAAR